MNKKFNKQRVKTRLTKALLPVFLFFFVFSFADTFSFSGQSVLERRVSMSVENMKIKDVLKKIEETDSVQFAYLANPFNVEKQVTLSVRDSPLVQVLGMLFESKAIFEDRGNVVVIKPANDEATSKIQVNGKVTDEKGVPIPGVNVQVKETVNGTITDAEGKYSLSVEDTQAVLVFSFVGYISQEVQVGAKNEIDIQLALDKKQLEEVVVVGYGAQKRENITGAISSIKGDNLVQRQVVNPVATLQGLLPGVQITQSSGNPGDEGLNIRIRGQGTYSDAGSDPLILVNGVPGSLSDLNPNTIENISVLKDAASCAIYGARAANGVILVTTKDGSQNGGGLHAAYNFNLGMNQATRLPEVVTNSVDYMNLFNQAMANSGITDASNLYPQTIIDLYKNPSDPIRYPSADWIALMFKTAPTYMHNLSFSGGKKTTYDISLGYVDQTGVMEAFNYKKYNFLLNLASEVNSRLKIGLNLGLKAGDRSQPRNGAHDAFWQTLAHPPTTLPRLPDGSGRYSFRAYNWENVRNNQFAANNNLTTDRDYQLSSQIWTDLKIAKGLNWYTKGAVNIGFGRYKTFSTTIPMYNYFAGPEEASPSNVGGNGMDQTMDQSLYKNLYTYLNYEKEWGKHLAGLQAGFSQEQMDYYRLQATRPGFSAGAQLQEMDAGDPSPQFNSGTSNTWALQSFFGRFRYNYAEKYLFESNLRYDGSSRLSKKNRWGLFPSFSFAWRMMEENFMKGLRQSGPVNDIKLRLSWGQLGNQNIGNYPYQSLIKISSFYPFGNTLSTGASQKALNNENITWETTTMSNIGLDLVLFKHLNLTLEAYQKDTKDILRGSQITGAIGLDAPTVNDGSMRNRGLELSINYANKMKVNSSHEITYNLGFNISGYRNTTTKFGKMQDNWTRLIEEGLPWDSFYLLQWDGIFQTEEEIKNSPKQYGDGLVPGDLKFKDINGDNVVNDEDRVKMTHGVFPSYTFGFTANLGWKGFDLYCFLQGVHDYKRVFKLLTPFATPPLKYVVEQAWTPENHSNTMPKLYFSDKAGHEKVEGRPSTFLLQDLSYTRIKQLQLGYTFPGSIVGKVGLQKVRLYVAADNLATFTKFKGTDPEKAENEFMTYPQNRIFSFGLSATF